MLSLRADSQKAVAHWELFKGISDFLMSAESLF